MSFSDLVTKDARLRILQALQRQTDHRLGDTMLVPELDSWGHRRTREWIRTQLRALAELGAVDIVNDSPAVMVAELTRAGQDHVLRRGVIEGILKPPPGE